MLIEMFFECLNFFLTYLEACDQALWDARTLSGTLSLWPGSKSWTTGHPNEGKQRHILCIPVQSLRSSACWSSVDFHGDFSRHSVRDCSCDCADFISTVHLNSNPQPQNTCSQRSGLFFWDSQSSTGTLIRHTTLKAHPHLLFKKCHSAPRAAFSICCWASRESHCISEFLLEWIWVAGAKGFLQQSSKPFAFLRNPSIWFAISSEIRECSQEIHFFPEQTHCWCSEIHWFFWSPVICSRNPSYEVIMFVRNVCVFPKNSFDFPRTCFCSWELHWCSYNSLRY